MENKGFIEIDIEKNAVKTNLTAFKNIYRVGQRNNARNWVKGVFLVIFIVMFLPWTQNIRSKGIITTLRQEERPQELNTIIAGRVLKWMVKEGDYVQEGDTILQLGEVKVDYFDPKLLQRTREQIDAKKMSIDGYRNKAITAQ
ncbi:MAG: biotin/lipoyl-binding protein, partial [Chitinophagaceae bacterium]